MVYGYGKRFTRKEVLQRLRKEIAAGRPIIGTGVSNGMIGRCEELGGADLIICYHTCRARMKGLGIEPPGKNPNAETLDLGEEVLTTVKETPVIAGFDTTDGTWRLDKFLDRVEDVGFSGVIIFPTVSLIYEKGNPYRARYEQYGVGITRELEATRLAQERALFTMTYVRDSETSIAYAKADIDAICVHCGGTMGGVRDVSKELNKWWGITSAGLDLSKFSDMAKFVQGMIDDTVKVKPDIIMLAHGGVLSGPDDTVYLYEHTDAVGFLGASSFERIPVERAVTNTVKEFKAKSLKKK